MNKKLVAFGLGAVVLYLILRPKTAKAEAPRSEVEPLPAAPPVTPTSEKFTDPGTGQTIAGPSTPIAAGGNYTVKRGESWSNIASRTYGDYRWWPFLWDVNRAAFAGKYIAPDTLNVGDLINLPVAVAGGPKYKARIFERAKAHAEYWKIKLTPGTRTRPMPAIVLELTDTRIG